MALYIAEETAAMFGQSRPLGIFWRLGLDPDPLRLWMGCGDYPVTDEGDFIAGFPTIDEEDDIYYGAGQWLNVPDLEVLINNLADRLDFMLAGFNPEVLSQLEEDPPTVTGCDVRVGIAPLDANWQPLSEIVALWTGTADYWATSQAVVKGLETPQNIAMLSCYSGGPGRRRPRRTSASDPQHQRLHPGDLFFNRYSLYRAGFTLSWPRF